nr:hypothetical protein [Falsiroseomonas frigidaquae]
MEQDGRLLRLAQQKLKLFAAPLQRDRLVADELGRHAICDGLDNLLALALELDLFRSVANDGRVVLLAELIDARGIDRAEFSAELFVHQMLAQGTQHHRFKLFPPHELAVVARPLVTGRSAAELLGRDSRVAAAAAPAAGQARKQVLRAVLRPERLLFLVQLALHRLHAIPEILTNDPELRHRLAHDLGVRIGTGHPPAAVRVLDVAEAIPDELANIEFIVEDAGAALAVAINGACTPFAAGRRFHAGLVQRRGDRLRRDAAHVVGKDAPDDLSLRLIDGALAACVVAIFADALHHVIPEAPAAAGHAFLDTAAQTAAGFVRQVF